MSKSVRKISLSRGPKSFACQKSGDNNLRPKTPQFPPPQLMFVLPVKKKLTAEWTTSNKYQNQLLLRQVYKELVGYTRALHVSNSFSFFLGIFIASSLSLSFFLFLFVSAFFHYFYLSLFISISLCVLYLSLSLSLSLSICLGIYW